MTLITSISGIRGTIGGIAGNAFTPYDIVKYTLAYGEWIKGKGEPAKIVLGRDARPSGSMVKNIVSSTLCSIGIDVIDIDYATTPTVEMAVTGAKASGGIIITASHNPENWNALKLLNAKGQFLSPKEAEEVFNRQSPEKTNFSQVDKIGKLLSSDEWLEYHLDKIIGLSLVDREAIQSSGLRIVADVVNSVGAISIPPLLDQLGIRDYEIMNKEMHGKFAHNPEPLPANLIELSKAVQEGKYDLGIAVDPDVDRLCFVCEDGSFFGEEYTLVAVADYWLSHMPGNTVSNLSSSRALSDITKKYGGKYFASAVGEINVVEEMIRHKAVIGGEGNGGVIIPDLHYGRDALAGIALFLSFLAKEKVKTSELRRRYPDYHISKNKIDLPAGISIDDVLQRYAQLHPNTNVSTLDGVKVDLEDGWIHLRKSNTEPIIRIYAEMIGRESADNLAKSAINELQKIINK